MVVCVGLQNSHLFTNLLNQSVTILQISMIENYLLLMFSALEWIFFGVRSKDERLEIGFVLDQPIPLTQSHTQWLVHRSLVRLTLTFPPEISSALNACKTLDVMRASSSQRFLQHAINSKEHALIPRPAKLQLLVK